MKKKIIVVALIFIIAFIFVKTSYAESLIDQVIGSGNNISTTPGDNDWGKTLSDMIKTDIVPALQSIGYLIFAIVTVYLGIKYMWSGYEGKSSVKDTLPTFLISVILFYFASNIVTLISGDSIFTADNWTVLSGGIYSTALLIAQYLSFGTLLFVGLKYMFASAEQKANLKETLTPVVIGIVFVFLSSKVVQFILTATGEVIE